MPAGRHVLEGCLGLLQGKVRSITGWRRWAARARFIASKLSRGPTRMPWSRTRCMKTRGRRSSVMVNPRKAYPVDPGLIPVFERSGRAHLGHALETVVLSSSSGAGRA